MEHTDNVKELSGFLLENGIKPSFQRVRILQRLSEKKDHPTVNEIYKDLVVQIPSLSKTTVYNTLNLFIKEGLARSINVHSNEARYDLILQSHGHFICSECGEIYDFEVPKDRYFDFLPEQSAKVTGCEITVRGICKKCTEKNM